MFANEATYKGLISKIYKHLLQLDTHTHKTNPKNRTKKKHHKWAGSSHYGLAVINPTSTHEDTDSTPGLAQWVKDLALP